MTSCKLNILLLVP